MGDAVSALLGLKGAPRTWDTHIPKDLTSSMNVKQSRYDGSIFHRCEPLGEHIAEKAGKHIDHFLVTGPEQNVERFLEQARDKLNMQDAVLRAKQLTKARCWRRKFASWTKGTPCKAILSSFKELSRHLEGIEPKPIVHQKLTTRSHKTQHESTNHVLAK